MSQAPLEGNGVRVRSRRYSGRGGRPLKLIVRYVMTHKVPALSFCTGGSYARTQRLRSYRRGRWPSAEAFAAGPVDSKASRQMHAAIAEEFPEVVFERLP
jgi:hypothetical protein